MPNFYMLRCKGTTYQECIDLKLFGQTEYHLKDILKIKKGDFIFLNKVGSIKHLKGNTIEGPFYADSDGALNINPNAWGGKFPSQVKITSREKTKIISYQDYVNFLDEVHVHDKIFYDLQIPNEIGTKLLKALNVVFDSTLVNLNPIEKNTANSDVNFRKYYTAEYRCEDGHFVRSLSEVVIDNWLYTKGYIHSYETRLPIDENLCCDFYLKDFNVYIEFWGLQDEKYLSRKENKINLYKKYNHNLINLESTHLKDLGTFLEKEILKYKQ